MRLAREPSDRTLRCRPLRRRSQIKEIKLAEAIVNQRSSWVEALQSLPADEIYLTQLLTQIKFKQLRYYEYYSCWSAAAWILANRQKSDLIRQSFRHHRADFLAFGDYFDRGCDEGIFADLNQTAPDIATNTILVDGLTNGSWVDSSPVEVVRFNIDTLVELHDWLNHCHHQLMDPSARHQARQLQQQIVGDRYLINQMSFDCLSYIKSPNWLGRLT